MGFQRETAVGYRLSCLGTDGIHHSRTSGSDTQKCKSEGRVPELEALVMSGLGISTVRGY